MKNNHKRKNNILLDKVLSLVHKFTETCSHMTVQYGSRKYRYRPSANTPTKQWIKRKLMGCVYWMKDWTKPQRRTSVPQTDFLCTFIWLLKTNSINKILYLEEWWHWYSAWQKHTKYIDCGSFIEHIYLAELILWGLFRCSVLKIPQNESSQSNKMPLNCKGKEHPNKEPKISSIHPLPSKLLHCWGWSDKERQDVEGKLFSSYQADHEAAQCHIHSPIKRIVAHISRLNPPLYTQSWENLALSVPAA